MTFSGELLFWTIFCCRATRLLNSTCLLNSAFLNKRVLPIKCFPPLCFFYVGGFWVSVQFVTTKCLAINLLLFVALAILKSSHGLELQWALNLDQNIGRLLGPTGEGRHFVHFAVFERSKMTIGVFEYWQRLGSHRWRRRLRNVSSAPRTDQISSTCRKAMTG
jgi:hypothetical protein